MRKKERYEKVIAWFQDNVPVAETELHYNNPYELLIAVILSARTFLFLKSLVKTSAGFLTV